ncbi:MAG TPA: HEAT repeat domain-containing protein [Armatimonadota bacterium]|jgi:HEAT repeat protein
MKRSLWDRLFHGEDEEFDEGEDETLAVAAAAQALQPTPPPTPPVDLGPTPPIADPARSAPEQPTSSLRAVRAWAGAEAVELLGELSPAARDRAAEALQIWHDADTQLIACARHTGAITDASATLTAGPLSTQEFAPDLAALAQVTEAQRLALDNLLVINRGRAHEWVLAAVQTQRQWGPENVIRLFNALRIGPLTLADLQSRLRSMDAGPRAWAAEALGALDDPDAVGALLNLLKDPDPAVRVAAVASLGRKADITTLHALGQVVKRDPDWLVRLKAISAAESFTGDEAIGFWHDLLRDVPWWRELQVLDNVTHADPTRPTPPREMPVGTYEKVRRTVLETLFGRIEAELPNADPAHRGWMMDVLGDTGDERAVPLLSSALQDVEQEVRLKALHSLGRIGTPAVVDLLLPALKDQHSQVRIQAAEALGECNDFRAVEPLLDAFQDSNQFVRAAVTVAIGKIVDTRALKPLIAALNDPDKDVRDQTQAAIQRMSDPRTMTVINGMLEAGGLKKPLR